MVSQIFLVPVFGHLSFLCTFSTILDMMNELEQQLAS
jgi:hypothetical protein